MGNNDNIEIVNSIQNILEKMSRDIEQIRENQDYHKATLEKFMQKEKPQKIVENQDIDQLINTFSQLKINGIKQKPKNIYRFATINNFSAIKPLEEEEEKDKQNESK